MAKKKPANNYILEYYQKISDGSEIVGEWILKWYSYIVEGLQENRFSFDKKAADKVILFCENFARHHEGSLAPNLIRLELWQKAMLSVIFGIMDSEGNRQFREVFVQVGRKNGKTLLAAAIAEYMLFMDGEYGARLFFCAPKLDQSRLCFNALDQMIRNEPELCELTKKRRTDIYVEDTNSSAQPMAFSYQKSDGLNPSLAVCDEISSWPGDGGLKQYEVLKSALGARRQPLLMSISTAGYINEGIYDELVKRSTAVIRGVSKETRLAPFLYQIDDIEKWNDINELKKANPNLGVSVSVDYMLEEIAVAESSLSKKSEFLTKYANVKQSSSLCWFTAQNVKKMFGYKRTLEEFRNHYALGGIDLSQTTDLTSACVLIEKDGVIWTHSHFWLPGERLAEAVQRDGIPYQIMIEKGFLSLSGDEFINYRDVYEWFMELVKVWKIYPLQIGYDRYSAQYLVQDLEKASFHMESVFQGYNLTGIEDTFEGMLREGRIRDMDDNDLLKIHMMDSAQMIESNTSAHSRKKLVKISKYAHVDGVAAILDAMCMRQNHWAEMGKRLSNAG